MDEETRKVRDYREELAYRFELAKKRLQLQKSIRIENMARDFTVAILSTGGAHDLDRLAGATVELARSIIEKSGGGE